MMNDLISRQEATTLPVLPKEYREYQTNNLDDAYELGWNDCQKYVEQLPSAQPEIMRCGDCKHYYFTDNHIPREQWYTCELDGERWRKPDDYCSFVVRRTDEEAD